MNNRNLRSLGFNPMRPNPLPKTPLRLFFTALATQPKLLQLSFFWLPMISGFLLLIAGAVYGYETEIARPSMVYMGVPKTQQNLDNLTHILRNQGFMLAYSEKLANPLWVTYQVTQSQKPFGKRPRFQTDWRSLKRIRYQDYTGSGYSRGHNAPNYVIASRYGYKAQQQTFLMTNISPQLTEFNTKIWQRLEEVSADYFSKWYPKFWVMTGPIFDPKPKWLTTAKIAIPKAFYKIFIRPADKGISPIALAFVMPQTAPEDGNLLDYVTTIDEVESLTGIDFFWQLDDRIEETLEASKNDQAWRLSEVAQLPSRY